MFRKEHKPKIFIHQSELDIIANFVKDYSDSETGGDFFGFWTKDNDPVIQFVIGPGQNTTRTSASFFQDIPYLKDCGRLLNEQYGLEHIGAWHSHHHLSLTHPSSGDINTMRHALGNSNLNTFLISICNIANNGTVTLHGYLFGKEFQNDYIPCEWAILNGVSPIREAVWKKDSTLFVSPNTRNTIAKTVNLDSENGMKIQKPELPTDSFWRRKEGVDYLREAFEKLQKRDDIKDPEIIQVDGNRIAISFQHEGKGYEIRFPHDYPKNSPEVVEKNIIDEDNKIPVKIRRIFKTKHKSDKYVADLINSLEIIEGSLIIIRDF